MHKRTEVHNPSPKKQYRYSSYHCGRIVVVVYRTSSIVVKIALSEIEETISTTRISLSHNGFHQGMSVFGSSNNTSRRAKSPLQHMTMAASQLSKTDVHLRNPTSPLSTPGSPPHSPRRHTHTSQLFDFNSDTNNANVMDNPNDAMVQPQILTEHQASNIQVKKRSEELVSSTSSAATSSTTNVPDSASDSKHEHHLHVHVHTSSMDEALCVPSPKQPRKHNKSFQ
eukprot:m.173603 g.173603  ORF g.173603 m.173603 type:complete len:226 (-) comp31734_c0_seq2:361-1038(-)